jgi:hypothetical protein
VPRPGGRFDSWGFLLSSLAFGLTLVRISQVGIHGWGSLWVRGLIVGGLLSLIAFIAYELRRSDPLLDVRMFANPQFLNSNIAGWVSTVAQFGSRVHAAVVSAASVRPGPGLHDATHHTHGAGRRSAGAADQCHTAVLGWQVRPDTSEAQVLAQIGVFLRSRP